MKKICLVGLCLTALSCIGAFAAATASATLPAFEQNKEEIKTNLKFEMRSEESIFKEVGGIGATVKCLADRNEGEALTNGPQHATMRMRFISCLLGSTNCESGTEAGVIETKKLEGWLFYINEGEKKVGEFWTEEGSTEKIFAHFKCGGTNITVYSIGKTELPPTTSPLTKASCVAGEIPSTQLNTARETFNLELAVANGAQAVKIIKYGGKEFECELEMESGSGRKRVTFSSFETIKWLPAGTLVELKA